MEVVLLVCERGGIGHAIVPLSTIMFSISHMLQPRARLIRHDCFSDFDYLLKRIVLSSLD